MRDASRSNEASRNYHMRILGIETSADDTGIALIEATGEFGVDFRFLVRANEVASQQHAQYGGIYPNVAKNEHIKNLPLLLEKVRYTCADMPDVIAVTVGPGIEPCLWTGITFAQKLAAQWSVPLVAVNHMEGHIIMSLMRHENQNAKIKNQNGMQEFEYPALALLISGGHTELILMKEFGAYEYLGRTRDDAAGEAFDKVARLLGLPYPGGPEISRLAAEARNKNIESAVKLPRPMMHEDNFDFSFSGLKTAVRRAVEAEPLDETKKLVLAREFEDAVADVLVGKTLRAVEEFGAQTVLVGGGVSANTHIREELGRQLSTASCQLLVPPPSLATDNALMIALAGYFRAKRGEFAEPGTIIANGTMTLI